MQFVDDERHLLGGGNQQRGETNRGGVDFDGFGDDRLRRDLLAEVNDGVAVVGEDGLDEVLADVMHIAVDGGDDDRAFGDAFHLLEIILKMGDGLLHHFGGLQHEGQDQFARAEFVADFFHGGEQDVVEGVDGGFECWSRRGKSPRSMISSISASTPSLWRWTIYQCRRCSGVMPSVGSAAGGDSAASA